MSSKTERTPKPSNCQGPAVTPGETPDEPSITVRGSGSDPSTESSSTRPSGPSNDRWARSARNHARTTAGRAELSGGPAAVDGERGAGDE